MLFCFRNINNQNSWFSVFVVIVVILQIDLNCAAIPDQIIQVRVLKYDSLDSLPYGMCHKIFKNHWYSEVGRGIPRPFFWDLEIFGKISFFTIFVFWLKWLEICWNVSNEKFLRNIEKWKNFPLGDFSGT